MKRAANLEKRLFRMFDNFAKFSSLIRSFGSLFQVSFRQTQCAVFLPTLF